MQEFICYCTVFAVLYFQFEGNFQGQAPGAYIQSGDLMEGFWGYKFGGQIFGAPSTWRGYGNEKFQNRNSKEGLWSLTKVVAYKRFQQQ